MIVMLAIAGLLMPVFAADITHLIVNFNNGSKASFVLADKPTVKFEGKQINIKSEALTAGYAMADVRNFVFGDITMAAIADVEAGEMRYVFVNPDELMIIGATPGATVTVTSVQGVGMLSRCVAADGTATIDLSTLPHNIYIVTTTPTGQSIKIKH